MKYSIRIKILVGFILVVATIFLVNVIQDIKNHQQEEAAMATIQRYQTARALVVNVAMKMNAEQSAVRGYLTNRDQQHLVAFENSRQGVQQDLNSLDSLLTDDPELLTIIRYDVRPALNALENVMISARDRQEYRIESELISVQFERLLEARIKLSDRLTKRQEEVISALTQNSRDSYQSTLLLDGVITVVALVLGLFIARSITSPLQVLIKGIRRVGKGDYQPIENLRTNDEIGEMVLAFNNMAAIVKANQIDLEQQNEELQAQGEELAAQNEEIISQQEELQSTMVKLCMQEETLNRLYQFSQSLTRTIDLDILLKTVLAGIMEQAGAVVGAVLLYDKETKELTVQTSMGLSRAEDQSVWQLGEGLLGQAAQQKRVLVASYGEGRLRTRGLRGELDLASEIYLPLVLQDNLLGVIVVGRLEGDRFNSEEKQFLAALTDQAAVALDNALAHLETRQALLRIQEVDRLKSELINTVSHELRTPLASILGFAELLLKKPPSAARAQKYLETIYNEAVRLTGLINNFLDLQRIETGRLEFTKSSVDLAGLISETVEVYQAQSSQHSLVVNVQEGLPLVWADSDRIVQVIGNLLSNAIKYSPNGGVVEIRAFCRSADMVEMEVQDYGLGIPEDAQQNLFQPFFRVDNSDRRQIGGTGLGLAISCKIIRAHGGDLRVKSVHGQGSTFTISLPVNAATPAAATTTIARQEAVTQARDTVLVVEDDQAMADLLVEALSANGYATKVVDNGSAALTSVWDELPSVILLDLTLAGPLSGWDVLRKIKQDPLTSKVPVIISSCVDKRHMGAELGAADYFVKPFPIDKLVESVYTLTRMPDGAVGLHRPNRSGDIEKNVRTLLESQGFAIQGVINREELLVITLGNQQSPADREVI